MNTMTPATALSTHNIKVLSLPIEITTNHKPFLKEFCRLTSAWVSPANGETPAVRFGVIQKRRLTHIEKDGVTVYRLAKDYQLCPMLMDRMRMSCYENVKDFLIFHAGALVKEGKAILLPAQSGSGKTTLTLGLMNYGYRYFTDEEAAIHHKTLEVVPNQRPLYVWTWSRPLRKEVREGFKIFRYRDMVDTDTKRWQYLVPREGAVMPGNKGYEVKWIIFPRYTPKGKTELKPLSPAQAAFSLMQNCFNQKLFPDGGLKVCIELAQRARCYTLEMGNLDRACELIEDLQGQGF